MKKLAIGIDIGGTNTKLGLVDAEGEMYGESVISTRQFPDFDQYVEELYIGIQSLIKNIDFPMELVGVGIGAPNANYYNGTIENAANLEWKGIVPVEEKLKRFFPNIPVIITNISVLLALYVVMVYLPDMEKVVQISLRVARAMLK